MHSTARDWSSQLILSRPLCIKKMTCQNKMQRTMKQPGVRREPADASLPGWWSAPRGRGLRLLVCGTEDISRGRVRSKLETDKHRRAGRVAPWRRGRGDTVAFKNQRDKQDFARRGRALRSRRRAAAPFPKLQRHWTNLIHRRGDG